MYVARVIGKTVSTIKDVRLQGLSLVQVQRLDSKGNEQKMLIAVDTVGAGVGEIVLVACGSAARLAANLQHAPIDLAVVGIVDEK